VDLSVPSTHSSTRILSTKAILWRFGIRFGSWGRFSLLFTLLVKVVAFVKIIINVYFLTKISSFKDKHALNIVKK